MKEIGPIPAPINSTTLQFPSEHLPPGLKPYVSELARRYSVPVGPVTLCCLTTAVAAVGKHAQYKTGWGLKQTACNMFVALGANPFSNLKFAVQHIAEPFRKKQAEAFDLASKTNRVHAAEQLSILQEQAYHIRKRGTYLGDDQNYLSLMWQIGELERRLRPALIIDDLRPATLRKGLETSADGGLFCLPSDLSLDLRTINYDLLSQIVGRKPLSNLFQRDTPISAAWTAA